MLYRRDARGRPARGHAGAACAARPLRRVHGRACVSERERRLPPDDDGCRRADRELRDRARAAGLWAPHIGPEAGGTGRGFLAYAYLNEQIGRSYWGQLVFGCQAPDAGNGEILALHGTPQQRERWLRPLVAGEVRSFFGMTEPERLGRRPDDAREPGAQRRRRVGDRRHKWFSTGADGSAFGIVMAVTDPGAAPHRRASLFIVPDRRRGRRGRAPDRGVRTRRPRLEHALRGALHRRARARREHARRARRRLPDRAEAARPRAHPPRHALARPDAARVRSHVLVQPAPARPSASALADKQTIQTWIADSAAEISACRLMTLAAAGQGRPGRAGARRGLGAQGVRRAGAARRRSTGPCRRTARSASPATRRSRRCTSAPASRASTTAPTRCTAWSSRGGSSTATGRAMPGASSSGAVLDARGRRGVLRRARHRCGAALRAERLGDGHSNLTFLVERGGERFVLRRPPPAAAAALGPRHGAREHGRRRPAPGRGARAARARGVRRPSACSACRST